MKHINYQLAKYQYLVTFFYLNLKPKVVDPNLKNVIIFCVKIYERPIRKASLKLLIRKPLKTLKYTCNPLIHSLGLVKQNVNCSITSNYNRRNEYVTKC